MHANIYVHYVEIALRAHTASNGLQKKIRSSEASNPRKWPSGVVTLCQAKRALFRALALTIYSRLGFLVLTH